MMLQYCALFRLLPDAGIEAESYRAHVATLHVPGYEMIRRPEPDASSHTEPRRERRLRMIISNPRELSLSRVPVY